MIKQMAETPLPPTLVSLFGHIVPWIELILSALLILGLFTRWTLTASMLFMTALTFGITLKQDWPAAGLQLGYGFVIFALMYLREANDRTWVDLARSRPPHA
jgi:thiosulfate dehydrogenase [quinone] large subunit